MKNQYALNIIKVVCVHAQSYPTLGNPMNCSLPGSSVHGISQARMGCYFLLQGTFPTQESNLSLLHRQVDSYHCATRKALSIIYS